MNKQIKNVIFDIGNVMVHWDPISAIKKVFPEQNAHEFYKRTMPLWAIRNEARLSELQAIALYSVKLGVAKDKISELFYEYKISQKPIEGSLDLVIKLNKHGLNLFSITDNIKEVIEYYKKHTDFIHYFRAVVSSDDVGVLKPDRRIYEYLLNEYDLRADESIFIDDLLINVKGAEQVGIKAFVFKDPKSCERELKKCGVFNYFND